MAILSKDGIYGALGFCSVSVFDGVSQINTSMVSSYDSRRIPSVARRESENTRTAWTEFTEALAESKDNGWTVEYVGEPNYG